MKNSKNFVPPKEHKVISFYLSEDFLPIWKLFTEMIIKDDDFKDANSQGISASCPSRNKIESVALRTLINIYVMKHIPEAKQDTTSKEPIKEEVK